MCVFLHDAHHDWKKALYICIIYGVGVMKIGNIVPRTGIELTSLAFRASVLSLHHVSSLMSLLYITRQLLASEVSAYYYINYGEFTCIIFFRYSKSEISLLCRNTYYASPDGMAGFPMRGSGFEPQSSETTNELVNAYLSLSV